MSPWQKVVWQDVIDGYPGPEANMEALDEEAVIDFMPDGGVDELCVLQYPVFPRAFPIELKGTAV